MDTCYFDVLIDEIMQRKSTEADWAFTQWLPFIWNVYFYRFDMYKAFNEDGKGLITEKEQLEFANVQPVMSWYESSCGVLWEGLYKPKRENQIPYDLVGLLLYRLNPSDPSDRHLGLFRHSESQEYKVLDLEEVDRTQDRPQIPNDGDYERAMAEIMAFDADLDTNDLCGASSYCMGKSATGQLSNADNLRIHYRNRLTSYENIHIVKPKLLGRIC